MHLQRGLVDVPRARAKAARLRPQPLVGQLGERLPGWRDPLPVRQLRDDLRSCLARVLQATVIVCQRCLPVESV